MDHQDARFLDLLRKWQSGDFTRRDEQEMQALTESDEFRRETWQGFQSHPEADHEGGLAGLSQGLRQDTEEMRPVVIARPLWMAAAAAIVLLLSAVFFFRKNSPAGEDSAPMAVQEEALNPSPVAGQADIAASEQADMPPGPAAAQPARAADGRLEKPVTTAATYAHSDESAIGPVPTGTAGGQSPAVTAAADDLAMAPQRAKAEEEKPVERQVERATDKEIERKKETVAKPLPAAPLAKADTLWSPTGSPPDMAKRRKAARDAILPAQSGPADSWEAFQDYLRQTARLTPLAKEKGVSGTVRLQFSVSANGEPQGFITLRSVGYGCDQEAIRLVKDWVWVRGQNPVVTVEIPFVR